MACTSLQIPISTRSLLAVCRVIPNATVSRLSLSMSVAIISSYPTLKHSSLLLHIILTTTTSKRFSKRIPMRRSKRLTSSKTLLPFMSTCVITALLRILTNLSSYRALCSRLEKSKIRLSLLKNSMATISLQMARKFSMPFKPTSQEHKSHLTPNETNYSHNSLSSKIPRKSTS